MVRTQIQLTELQFEALRARASAEGRSMADLIRGLVDESLSGAGRPGPEERRRRALAAIVRSFQDDVTPVLGVQWVDAELHAEGTAALLTAGRRELSLVDCISFACMRRQGLTRAFRFDRRFREQGFASA